MNQRSLKRLRTTSPRRRQPCVNVRGWHCIFSRQTYVALRQCPRGWIGDAEHYLTVGSLLTSSDSVTVIWLAAAECRGARHATICYMIYVLYQTSCKTVVPDNRHHYYPPAVTTGGHVLFLGTTDVGLWFCLSTKIIPKLIFGRNSATNRRIYFR